ncbi:MAG TPA: bifunctional diaminohydroxyphosphoribosylaminopyrimidine deaminase/5-amino-6-(5-phosphoribosylamino)uracil reductase RibD [Flavobacterium sp.]|jgi:diaminohydroxyphosphoribosylaminopyrimidine deaminase/5-amino-6-(5-phosphoribosylamino)uracil reductase|nr:bifunctional diaminohydroxyphosphoribosylaminopyrimidine deaminase/5-amino-6-(5-phosphoribosylamino)uracil reductase RibD [Flavobacterium sp.]HQV35312.1 bifunctional diaminohydroxyphosphoribosylaminopyrimidine deaminase/5-amino-6-(5-phosphoribosylamino)uracil reductase RibD [Flavobacterium sp.]HQX02625.1 bifunctional diaminohydroxyphosphoribosylaminopyrimidine deaminase/5-amino-6-(5-phosphoribosylamino)uracil reductase RibD [Flavobacterium sp.]HRZ30988.1 bifunctional diaminohydroxyphosphoribo
MNHEIYIQRCLELAQNGLGSTYPNPMVGSVIVHRGKIIGEGWHQKAGEPHAEVNAINSVKNKSLLTKSTIYVSLEPCSHFGKTPPCSDLIIQHKIPTVIIGTVDPNDKVAGKGIEKLQKAGIKVKVGVLEKECRELNKRFFTFHTKKRPYIILKWAESADGFLSPLNKKEQKPVWITNVYARQLVHKWRTEEQAILVGTKTVLDDNPQLNARDWFGKNPIRIILDRSGKISEDYAVKKGSQKSIILTEQEILTKDENCIYENLIFGEQLPEKISNLLYQYQIQSVIVEGGRQTLQSFIDDDLWDEARIFKGNIILHQGTKAPILKGEIVVKQKSIKDELIIIKSHD